jgi:hypothetical protein
VLRIQTLLIQIRLFTLIRIRILTIFQRGNEPKTVFFIHLNLIFLVSRPNRTQTKGYFVKFSLPVNFVLLIRVAYGSGSLTPGNGSWEMIQILTDSDPQHWLLKVKIVQLSLILIEL